MCSPSRYKIILDHLKENGISDRRTDDVIGCFEYEYEKDGICYMDICICVQDEA